jgi:acyl carrier protein
MEIRDQVRQFIMTNFYGASKQELEDSTSLLDSGLVDSTGILELISYLESNFGITVADSETLPENLDSIGSIANFVARKKAKGS